MSTVRIKLCGLVEEIVSLGMSFEVLKPTPGSEFVPWQKMTIYLSATVPESSFHHDN